VIWHWGALDSQWIKLDRNPRPGMTLLLRANDGGYDETIGFDANIKKSAVRVVVPAQTPPEDDYTGDWRPRQNKPVALAAHLGHVATQAQALCQAVAESTHGDQVIRAGRWHDLGKAHEVFDATMHACPEATTGF